MDIPERPSYEAAMAMTREEWRDYLIAQGMPVRSRERKAVECATMALRHPVLAPASGQAGRVPMVPPVFGECETRRPLPPPSACACGALVVVWVEPPPVPPGPPRLTWWQRWKREWWRWTW